MPTTHHTASARGSQRHVSRTQSNQSIKSMPIVGAGDAELRTFNANKEIFVKADTYALLILTRNMLEETLMKVMRYIRLA